jgi:tetrapyrrole methylase family protein/MazG family protein
MFWVSFVERALEMLASEAKELQLASVGSCVERHYPRLSPDRPALIGGLGDVALCRQLRQRLTMVYPESHTVTLLVGLDSDLPALQELALGKLDRALCRGLSMLYLPPLECPGSVETFQGTVAHLRAPDGCPWDRKQTHQSLRDGFLEEAYEVLDALDQGDLDLLREELGDVLLHILLQAQIASENGEFTMSDVVCHVYRKIVYRHPHVFGDLAVDGVDQVLENWEALKRKEKGRDRTPESLFAGIPAALPALARTQALLRRAGAAETPSTGWDTLGDDITEAVQRLVDEPDGEARQRLVGDLLFGIAALGADAQIDTEGALRDANARFVERVLSAQGRRAGADVGRADGPSEATRPELTTA